MNEDILVRNEIEHLPAITLYVKQFLRDIDVTTADETIECSIKASLMKLKVICMHISRACAVAWLCHFHLSLT